MSFYQLALFVHVMGALALFSAVGLNFASMLRMLQSRNVARLSDWARLGLQAGRIIPITLVVIVSAGIYMVSTVWGWQTPWVDVVLATVIGHGIAVQTIENPRLARLHKAAIQAPAGPVPLNVHMLAHDELMWTADLTVTTTTVGMIFLMVMKPDLVISLVAIAVSLLIGLALAVPFWLTDHAHVHAARSGMIA